MSDENPVKTILVLSANPKGTTTLRLGEEIREIKQGLQRSKRRDSFAFQSGQAVRDFDIHRSILDYEPQIIHFSGHGAGDNGLVFEDNVGQQKLVDGGALAALFELFALQIKCVVLNACYSEIQAKAIAQHIDYVIGMSKEIGDTAAIKFAVGFYDALGAGRDFEFAYKLGCRYIRMAGIPEHLTPQLLKKQDFCRDNIDNCPSPYSPGDARNSTVVSPSPTPPSPTTPLISRQEDTAIAQYRQKVEEFTSDGVISWEESHILNHLHKQLGLTDQQASSVRKEVLEPYQIYKQQFTQKVAAEGYPLGDKAQAELNKFQKYYKIKDEYVRLLDREAEKQQAQRQRKLNEERLRLQEERAELQKQQQRKSSSQFIQTQSFDFETATLTVRIIEKRSGMFGFFGETSTSTTCEIERSKGQAESFQEHLGNSVFLEMVKIPGGSFLMGSPENELKQCEDEKPLHKVTIEPFFMSKFTVTQQQYQAIMGKNPSQFKGRKKPVECVTWDNAVQFCTKISQTTGKSYRLPSEAEWEYACRAGTTTPFHFGESITNELANYNGNYTYGSAPKGQSLEQTTDVGSFPANGFGLYDMHGNVSEWCQDSWHKNYNGMPTDGSAWKDENDPRYRMLRGGSWFSLPWDCRCAFRFGNERKYRYSFIGFRVVVASSKTSNFAE
ncbi:MAG: SUMF1/EgtB/PvdO family nonheme iron enzyme [Rivularia sp. (in: cyanobacteria)]